MIAVAPTRVPNALGWLYPYSITPRSMTPKTRSATIGVWLRTLIFFSQPENGSMLSRAIE